MHRFPAIHNCMSTRGAWNQHQNGCVNFFISAPPPPWSRGTFVWSQWKPVTKIVVTERLAECFIIIRPDLGVQVLSQVDSHRKSRSQSAPKQSRQYLDRRSTRRSRGLLVGVECCLATEWKRWPDIRRLDICPVGTSPTDVWEKGYWAGRHVYVTLSFHLSRIRPY